MMLSGLGPPPKNLFLVMVLITERRLRLLNTDRKLMLGNWCGVVKFDSGSRADDQRGSRGCFYDINVRDGVYSSRFHWGRGFVIAN